MIIVKLVDILCCLYFLLLELQMIRAKTIKNPACHGKHQKTCFDLFRPGSGFHCQRLQTKGTIIWKSRSTEWCKEESKMSHRGGIRAEHAIPKWDANGPGTVSIFGWLINMM